MNLLNSRGILFEGSIVSPTLSGSNAVVDRRFIEGVPYQDAEEFADWETFSYALAREPAQNIIQPGALNRSSSSTSAFTGSGTTGANILTLPGFLYAYEADSADMLAAYNDGDSVTTWHETNNTLDLISGAQKVFRDTGLGGRESVEFTLSSNARSLRAYTNVWSGDNTQTVYVVCAPGPISGSGVSAAAQTPVAMWGGDNTSNQHWRITRPFISVTDTRWQYAVRTAAGNTTIQSANLSLATTNDVPVIVTTRWNAGPMILRLDGTQVASGSNAGTFRNNPSTDFTIGDILTGTFSAPFRGQLACVYVYESAHDDATIAHVEQFLSDKYGIPL